MFWPAAAYVFQRVAQTWYREMCGTYEFVRREYDNHSTIARFYEVVFSEKSLGSTPLCIVPLADDIMNNKNLLDMFLEFLPKPLHMGLSKLFSSITKYEQKPPAERRDYALKVLSRAEDIGLESHPINNAVRVIREVIKAGEIKPSSTIFWALPKAMMDKVFFDHYVAWVDSITNEQFNAMKWRQTEIPFFNSMTIVSSFPDISRRETASKEKSRSKRALIGGRKDDSPASPTSPDGRKIQRYDVGLHSGSSPLVSSTQGGAADSSSAATSVKMKAKQVELVQRVPTLDETLNSSFLREMFHGVFLSTQLMEEEVELWEALTLFYNKYSVLRNEELKDRQLDIIENIKSILEKYEDQFRNPDALYNDLVTPIITCMFFREEEVAHYSRFHSDYQKLLREYGFVDSF
jgi:hypothetical protein